MNHVPDTEQCTLFQGMQGRQGWKAMLPACLECKVFKYVHNTLGHMGVDKYLEEAKYVFHVINLG
jgi:hypothetical protein